MKVEHITHMGDDLKYKPDLHTYHWSEISEFINDMLK